MIHFLHNLNTHIVFKRLFIFYQSFPKKSIYPLYSVTAINRASSRWCCCSITQLCLTLCDPMNLQHTRLPCPSPSPRACSNICPLSQWCHPTISSSVVPFSSCLQSFPASGSFLMSRLFSSGGQSIVVSSSASVLPMNIQGWFPSYIKLSFTMIFRLRSCIWKTMCQGVYRHCSCTDNGWTK